MIAWRLFALPLLVAALVLTGCGNESTELRAANAPRPGEGQLRPVPVILVPGIEASTLVDPVTGEAAWSSSLSSLVRHVLDGSAADRLRPGQGGNGRLVPGEVIRGLLTEDYYGGLIAGLAEGRTGCVGAESIGPGTDCVLLAWDWRQSFTRAAARLDRAIEDLRRAHRDPDLRVDLVAHSAGGLVVRYFMRFGARDVLDLEPSAVRIELAGVSKVRRAMLVGVPNAGSVLGLRLLSRGHALGMIRLPPELIAFFPSVYETLPHPGQAWAVDTQGRPVALDLFDPDTWKGLGLSLFDPALAARIRAEPGGSELLARFEGQFARMLERGRRFALALGRSPQTPVAYSLFGGDCAATPARYLVERQSAGPEGRAVARVRFDPAAIARPVAGVDYRSLMYAPGDGWITRDSLLARLEHQPAPFRVRNIVFACTGHALLGSDPVVRHNLLGQLRSNNPHQALGPTLRHAESNRGRD